MAIDAGMDFDGRDFLDAVKTLNRCAADVRAVLLTHWHNDHAAGAAALREKLGARIDYAVADAPFMTRGTAKRGIRSWLSDRLPEEGLLVLLKG